MADPGLSYLYKEPRDRQAAAEPGPGSSHTLRMSSLPRGPSSSGSTDWQAAVGNMENAKLALDTLKTLISDAVFLDEEAFTNANTLSLYQRRIQGQQRKIRDLEHQIEALRAEAESREAALQREVQARKQVQQTVRDLQAELENNAVVFNMHYQELLSRNDEIERLKVIIEGMSTSKA